MALIGNITNRGYIQGHINEANGILTGVITNSGQLGGQVIGQRGLKGDTGATGATGNGIASISKTGSSGNIDTYTITYTNGGTVTFTVTNGIDGADGVDGQDGYSPTATVTKSGNTATITITDKNGTTTANIYDGSGGGASAFIAEYGVTTYADVKDAYDDGSIILCSATVSDDNILLQLLDFNGASQYFSFGVLQGSGLNYAVLSNSNGWDSGEIYFASTDTATQLRDGLMTALDKQKLDGIASGAEVNVNADWNAISGDAQILNKPSIPANTSDLVNDSGYLTLSTLPIYDGSVV